MASESAEIRFRVLAALYVLLVFVGVGFAYARRPLDLRGSPALAISTPPAEAIVNGEPIPELELLSALNAAHGSAVLQQLMEEHVILQEAAREKVTLDDPESLVQLEALTKKTSDPMTYSALERDLRARLLLRKMLLRGVSQETRQETYQRFRQQLARFEVFTLRVSNSEDAGGALKALQQGWKFDEVVKRFGKDTGSTELGLVTLSTVQAMYGTDAATAVASLQSDGYSGVVSTPHGLVIFKVGKVLRTYDALKTAVEDILIDAKQGQFLYQLTHQARVSYPLAEALATFRSNVPDAKAPKETSVFAEPSAVPAGEVRVFAPPPVMAGGDTPVIFAPPPAAIPANGAFNIPEVPANEPNNVFAPPPEAEGTNHKTGVFAPLPQGTQAHTGVFAPLPSAVK